MYPVERGHRTCMERTFKPGTDNKIYTVFERCDHFRDIAEIIGVVCIAHDNIPAACFVERGEIRVAVAALLWPYHQRAKICCYLRCPVR